MAESLEASGVVQELIGTAGYRLLEFADGGFRPPSRNLNRFLVPEESEAARA
jgi:hypothetical protein